MFFRLLIYVFIQFKFFNNLNIEDPADEIPFYISELLLCIGYSILLLKAFGSTNHSSKGSMDDEESITIQQKEILEANLRAKLLSNRLSGSPNSQRASGHFILTDTRALT